MGYAGAISSDGRVAFVLNGKSEYIKSQIRTAKNKAGLKLNINEDEACKSMAKYLVDNFGFTKELKSISKFNASHHVPQMVLMNKSDVEKIYGIKYIGDKIK